MSAPIAFVNGRPAIEPCGDLFALTFPSGDAEVRLMLTRHALTALVEGSGRKALDMARVAEMFADPPVSLAKERKRGR